MTQPLTKEQQALSLFLPYNTLEYFDITLATKENDCIKIFLEEKNNPPLESRHNGLSVESKGFQDITITDFPARGKQVKLTFRRRRWQVGNEILKRNIDLCSENTQLEKEFGSFLKDSC